MLLRQRRLAAVFNGILFMDYTHSHVCTAHFVCSRQVFTPPSIMGISGSGTSYGDMLRGVKKEAKALKTLVVAGISVALAIGARVVLKV